MGIDKETKRLLYYEDDERAAEIHLDREACIDGRSQVDLRHDLQDCDILICAPETLYVFRENFDYQRIRQDFICGILSDETLGNKIHAFELQDNEYASRVHNLRSYDAISRDIITRWTYPFVPDVVLSALVEETAEEEEEEEEEDLGLNPSPNASGLVLEDERGIRCAAHYIYIDRGVAVPITSSIGPCSLINARTVISDNVTIHSSIIGFDCHIGVGAVIEDSYIHDGVVVGDNCVVRGAMLMDRCTVHENTIVNQGCVLSYDVVVGPMVELPTCTKVSLCRSDDVDESSDEGNLESYGNYDMDDASSSGGIDTKTVVSVDVLQAARRRRRTPSGTRRGENAAGSWDAGMACANKGLGAPNDSGSIDAGNSADAHAERGIEHSISGSSADASGGSRTDEARAGATEEAVENEPRAPGGDGSSAASEEDFEFDVAALGAAGAGYVWRTTNDGGAESGSDGVSSVDSEEDYYASTSDEDSGSEDYETGDSEDDSDSDFEIYGGRRRSRRSVVPLSELVPVPASWWVRKTERDLADAAFLFQKMDSKAVADGKRVDRVDNDLNSEDTNDDDDGQIGEIDAEALAREIHFKREVTETFLRCVLLDFDQRDVVQELNALKLAENRCFADIARYMFVSILDLSLGPPRDCLPENRKLYLNMDTTSSPNVFLKPLAQQLNKWRTLLMKYLRNQDDQIELLQTFEEYCLGDGVFEVPKAKKTSTKSLGASSSNDGKSKRRKGKKKRKKRLGEAGAEDDEDGTASPEARNGTQETEEESEKDTQDTDGQGRKLSSPYAPNFMPVLKLSYDVDILSEEAIFQWAKEREHATGDDRRFLDQSMKFIEWLKEAEEESDDEDESDDDT